ncbi:MAG: ATP-dependent RecD-like DNA helicase [Oscillospiraceae bacterium]|nr:ATP-dependent RecD-like DNA helicase [Oscillospiraceae bacterium]
MKCASSATINISPEDAAKKRSEETRRRNAASLKRSLARNSITKIKHKGFTMQKEKADPAFDPEGKEKLSGEVEEIIYQNEENGYTVCVISSPDGNHETLVGTMPMLSVGEEIAAYGVWTTHREYGEQFKVEYFEKKLPGDAESIKRYLSSHAVRGVGPKLAGKIVDRFKEATFEVIENSPELLCDIKGISPKRSREISDSFRMQFGMRNIMMFFGRYFGVSTSVRIYKRWGSAAIDLVRSNPYILCDEIYGIGFERADSMAISLGHKADSEFRLCAGIKYLLNYNAQSNGHCYLPRYKLAEAAAKMLDIPEKTVFGAIDNLMGTGELVYREFTEQDGKRTDAIYLQSTYMCEKYIAKKLCALNRVSMIGAVDGVQAQIERSEADSGIKFAAMQKKAVTNALESPVTVITGGPGTGKTTIIKCILGIFSRLGIKAALCAPTGRAAKRMSEATMCEAKTIHRLLETEFSENDELNFSKNENNLLEFDALIADEMSMVDVFLFSSLLKAIKPGARLILIGDADQLPSVGAGDVLNDIIKSKVFTVCRLDEIFRQDSNSHIAINAQRINRGEYPAASGKDGNFFIIRRRLPSEIVSELRELVKFRLPKAYGDQISGKIQVITPTRKGELGTSALNVMLQEELNPPSSGKCEHKYRDTVFREGDKVMQIRNNYDLNWESDERTGTGTGTGKVSGSGVFNGDIGYIETVDEEDLTLTVDYDGRKCEYDFSLLDEIEHAFAVTVHKSQGSEYPVVIIPLLTAGSLLSTRNLLYTAITRAREMVILIGEEASVKAMVDNNRHALRYSGLSEMLSEENEGKERRNY